MKLIRFCLPLLLVFSLTVEARGGLPEFTDLIESTSPAVVKINTVEKASRRGAMPLPRGRQDIPDIFRQLFEPRQMPERNIQSMASGCFLRRLCAHQ